MGSKAKDSTFEEHAVGVLKQGGCRITGARLAVIACLAKADSSLSAQAVHADIGRTGHQVDIVSVYRILETLMKHGLIHYIAAAEGYVACTMSHNHSESVEHLICTTCGKVCEREAPGTSTRALESQAGEEGFSPRSIRIEVLGECRDCSRTGAP